MSVRQVLTAARPDAGGDDRGSAIASGPISILVLLVLAGAILQGGNAVSANARVSGIDRHLMATLARLTRCSAL